MQELENVGKSGRSLHLSSFSTPGEGRCRRILGGLSAAGSALSAVLMLRLHSFNQPFTSFYRSKQFIIRPTECLDTCANPSSPGLLLHVEVVNWTLVSVPVWLHWNYSWLKSCPLSMVKVLTDHDTSLELASKLATSFEALVCVSSVLQCRNSTHRSQSIPTHIIQMSENTISFDCLVRKPIQKSDLLKLLQLKTETMLLMATVHPGTHHSKWLIQAHNW